MRVIIRAQWLKIVTYWLQIVMSWAPRAFSLKNANQARVLHSAHEGLSIYAMIIMPGQIEILSQGYIDNECRNKLKHLFINYT